MPAPTITVFSDFTCPFCYVTEAALRGVAASADAPVHYRAFELYPVPVPPPAPADEPGWREQVEPLAGELGLALRAPAFRPRTRKAHEAFRFARDRGVGDQMREALFTAYWAEERDIGRIDVLAELISRFDVDPADLRIALDIDQYREGVLQDQALAQRLRVTGVPVLYVGSGPHARVLLGAQTAAGLDEAIASR